MGYLDKAKAFMKEAGIDCAKSVTSAKSLLETKPLAKPAASKETGTDGTLTSTRNNADGDGMPDYPHEPCHICGSKDFWLRETSQWGKAEWSCSKCHPKPEGGNGQ